MTVKAFYLLVILALKVQLAFCTVVFHFRFHQGDTSGDTSSTFDSTTYNGCSVGT